MKSVKDPRFDCIDPEEYSTLAPGPRNAPAGVFAGRPSRRGSGAPTQGHDMANDVLGCPDCKQPIGSFHLADCPRTNGKKGPVEVTAVSPGPFDLLADLRRGGWRVAAHNDYAYKGQSFTFWLFTHATGVCVKGEGAHDIDAMREAISEIKRRELPI